MSSKIRPAILEAAIALFSDYGYFGVTTRDVAKKAGTTEGSIYRLFTSKDNLFEEALHAVLERCLGPEKFLMMMFEDRKKQGFPGVAVSAVRSWYASITKQTARLLMYAWLSKSDRWRERASAPLEKLIGILAASMERETKKAPARQYNATLAARGLIMALFQFKIVGKPASSVEEAKFVECAVRQWMHGFS